MPNSEGAFSIILRFSRIRSSISFLRRISASSFSSRRRRLSATKSGSSVLTSASASPSVKPQPRYDMASMSETMSGLS